LTEDDRGLTFVFMPADEKPSVGRVLEILKEAGETGATGPEIARQFTAGRLQRRMTIVNQILGRSRSHGRVVRGPMEPTKYYHRVPTYRWYITPAGVHFLAVGLYEGIRAAKREEKNREHAARVLRRRRLADLLTDAYDKYDPETTPRCERERVIRELRAQGCTLHDIGGVFGITRERVRQIEAGFKTGRCKCSRCNP